MTLFTRMILGWFIINALIVAVRALCIYRTPRPAGPSNRRAA